MAFLSYATLDGEIVGENSSGTWTGYLADMLGSTLGTVTSGGSLQHTYRYKPFGLPLSASGAGPVPRFRWVGSLGYRYSALDHSHYYVRRRHYGGATASWTSKDPARENAFSSYVYASSCPTSFVDPDGLDPCQRNRGVQANHEICLAPAIVTPCCIGLFIPFEAIGSFSMTLPQGRTPNLIEGQLLITVRGLRIWIPTGAGPCPPPSFETTDNYFTPMTSGFPGFQVYGRYWGRYRKTKRSGWKNEPSPIPPSSEIEGEWRLTTACGPRSRADMRIGRENYFFHIRPDPARRSTPITEEDRRTHNTRTRRTEFGVHPDGSPPGTAGCIAARSESVAERLRHCLMNLNENNIQYVNPLTIWYFRGR